MLLRWMGESRLRRYEPWFSDGQGIEPAKAAVEARASVFLPGWVPINGSFRRPFQGLPFVFAPPTQGSLRFTLGFVPSSALRTSSGECPIPK